MDYQFGPFRIDTTKRRVWRGDELIALTPKAFETLVVLVTRAGEVVEKDELLEAVWPDTVVEEGTVAQNISTLRRALGDTAETPTYIATVPRRGYRFLGPVVPLPAPDQRTSRAEAGLSASAPVTGPIHWRRSRFGWWVLAAGVAAIGFTALMPPRQQTADGPASPVVFAIEAPYGTTLSTTGGLLSVAPDGRQIVFLAVSPDGIVRLWVRAIDSVAARLLPGTEGASQPFWSWDSRYVEFFADGKLKAVDIASGQPRDVCEVPRGGSPLAGTANARGDILFSAIREGIYHVRPGEADVTTLIAREAEDNFVGWPQFLPDGRHFLFVISSTRQERTGIYVGALDSPQRVRVIQTRSSAAFDPSGYLLYVESGALVAQPFDAIKGAVRGEPVPIVQRVDFNAGTGRAMFSISRTGVLAYRRVTDSTLVWTDRTGRARGSIAPEGGYLSFALSPDGTRVAAARLDPQLGTSDIWIIDTLDGKERRLTFDSSWERTPLWSPNGDRILYLCQRGGRFEVHERAVDGSGPDRPVFSSTFSLVPEDWTHDGRLLFREFNAPESHDFWLIDTGAPRPRLRVPSRGGLESSGRVSPDGRWLAYLSHDPEPGLYVRSLTSDEPPRRIASAVYDEPRWRGDGRELFYLAPDMSLMSVEVQLSSTLVATPRRLFQTHAPAPSGVSGQAYDVAADGQRFVVKAPAAPPPITVVSGWTRLIGPLH